MNLAEWTKYFKGLSWFDEQTLTLTIIGIVLARFLFKRLTRKNDRQSSLQLHDGDKNINAY